MTFHFCRLLNIYGGSGIASTPCATLIVDRVMRSKGL